jgi:glycosyltransferase involved in cell wall biosynthesis
VSTRLSVVLASIGIPHDGLTLKEQSLGGSETAAIHVARALAARGHHVTVFANLPPRPGPLPRILDGVSWMPLGENGQHFLGYAHATPHDVTVLSRDVNLLRFTYQSAIRVLWCHDLALKRLRNPVTQCMWSTDYLYVLSPWQREQYRGIYGLDDAHVLVTRNGVDVASLPRPQTRDPLKLVYGSRPERGLEAALAVMERLQRAGSPLRLEVSWYDHEGLAPQMQAYYGQLRQRAEAMPNVVLKGALTQGEWHKQLATARALIYPGAVGQFAGFREIYAIAVAEAQACGTPVVTIGKGAVPGTLNGAGVVVGDESTDAGSPAYLDAFTAAVQALATDDLAWQRYHQIAVDNTPGLDWAGVAAQWEAHWLAALDQRVDDPWRVERHCARVGETELA